jgi:hypothetical protein
MSNIWANTGEPGADGLVESNELLRIKLPDTDPLHARLSHGRSAPVLAGGP